MIYTTRGCPFSMYAPEGGQNLRTHAIHFHIKNMRMLDGKNRHFFCGHTQKLTILQHVGGRHKWTTPIYKFSWNILCSGVRNRSMRVSRKFSLNFEGPAFSNLPPLK
jgi:hypothetical protein